jgi:hypothetical protein
MLKNFILFAVLFTVASCAFALLSPRAFTERRYRPCAPSEVESGNVGKFCHRYCVKYRFLHADTSQNCKLWETDVKDFSKPEDFEAFRVSGFVMIKERE